LVRVWSRGCSGDISETSGGEYCCVFNADDTRAYFLLENVYDSGAERGKVMGKVAY